MIAWILLVLSGMALGLMVYRRVRMTARDMKFQKDLIEEEAMDAAAPIEAPVVPVSEPVFREEVRPEPVVTEEPVKKPEPKVVKKEKVEEAPAPKKEEAPVEPVVSKRQATLDDMIAAAADEKPKVNVTATYKKADVLFGQKKFGEAEILFLQVVDADPQHLEAHEKLGMMNMRLGNFPQAEVYFNKLVNLKKDPVFFSNLGAALFQQQRLIEAAEAYENAIALDANRAARLMSLAQVYHQLDEFEKALDLFERAAKKKKKDVELHLILADYYRRFERDEDATATLKHVLDLDPYNEEAQAVLDELGA